MNTNKRIELVKAMEMLARAVNDERNILTWFTIGVADGDITENSVTDDIEYYIEDETFAELMDTFLYVMENARRSGGLYFDGILSKEAE